MDIELTWLESTLTMSFAISSINPKPNLRNRLHQAFETLFLGFGDKFQTNLNSTIFYFRRVTEGLLKPNSKGLTN